MLINIYGQDPDSSLLSTIRKIIRDEFVEIRREICEVFQADMDRIKDDILNLTVRITQFERKTYYRTIIKSPPH